MKKLLTLAAGLILVASTTFAASAQLSLPENNFPDTNTVSGIRLCILNGKTKNVTGLNLSVLALSEMGNFEGLDLGIFLGASKVSGDFTGVSSNLLNWHEGQSKGLNIGFINHINNMNGANIGAVNIVKNQALLNLGAVNYTMGNSSIDVGFINYAESTTFQLGFLNGTKNLDGIQIGLINYAENGQFPVLPVINFKKGL